MNFVIITGDSKGLGESAAKRWLEDGNHILGISRTYNEELEKVAKDNYVSYNHFECDLTDEAETNNTLASIHNLLQREEVESLTLINNAGMVEPIERVGSLDIPTVDRHVRLNVSVPILFSNYILGLADEWEVPLTLVNITSGAAEKTTEGWSVYSAGKAAINRFTAVTAKEQGGKGHTIIAYSPGVMDTEMQEEIRSASKDSFKDVDKFRELKESGKLTSPDRVAEVLKNLLSQEPIQNGEVYKLYDYIDKY
ncbi:(S)-benzoin forming benzil reductase [Salimicrobium halophilum]|uniref:Benzil reductase ((S)-benzoin forming) n=1 Tax=Salimicrobium halophilum TaxID=86666 RepID=A0A1G8TL22_9BACI|nr:(S)-benzoin forming benzil reductase [Salimicrobium halophilum]SDJ42153.1 benzil reductase ((S)-benzoin forming) [Salimicrobium halophilum]